MLNYFVLLMFKKNTNCQGKVMKKEKRFVQTNRWHTGFDQFISVTVKTLENVISYECLLTCVGCMLVLCASDLLLLMVNSSSNLIVNYDHRKLCMEFYAIHFV